MKLIIAGGRDYVFTEVDKCKLDELNRSYGITEVVSGGARGADACGEEWARDRGIKVKVFNADWVRYGMPAGPIRNREMAQYADAAVLFPGEKGTASMRKEAKRAGIPISVPEYEER